MSGTRHLHVTGTHGISDARRVAVDMAAEVLDTPRLRDVALVVSELVSNALEHGHGHAEVTIESLDVGLEITVASSSDGALRLDQAPVANSQIRGRGLRIVNSLTDAMVVRGVGDRIEIGVRIERR